MINKARANRLTNVTRLMPFIMTPALVCFAPVARGAEPLPDRQWRLGNDQLELQFQWKDNRVVVHRLLNRVSGRTIPITGDDFSLGIGDGSRSAPLILRFKRCARSSSPADGG